MQIHEKEELVKDVLIDIKKFNYLLWEAVVILNGEKTFFELGPIGVFGRFLAQIKTQLALYLYIVTFRELGAIRNLMQRISGEAAVMMLSTRIRAARRLIGAQDRDELGLTSHVRKMADIDNLDNTVSLGFKKKFQGCSTGEQKAQRMGLSILDLVLGLPNIMVQKFGLTYTMMFPDLPLDLVAMDSTNMNVILVMTGTCKNFQGLAVRFPGMPVGSHFAQTVSMTRAINLSRGGQEVSEEGQWPVMLQR